MKRIMIIVLQLATITGLCGMAAFAQMEEATTQTEVTVVAKPLTQSDIDLLRQNVQANKEKIITSTMKFNETEAKAFWPVYREYANAQKQMGEKRYQIIKEYAENYDDMTNAIATELSQRMFNLDKATYENREAFWPRFEKAIGAKQAAKFYQVDRRLTMMVDLQLSADVPILP